MNNNFKRIGCFLCIVLTLVLGLMTDAKAQTKQDVLDIELLKTYEDTLALLGYAMINDSLPEHRFASCRKLIPTLVNALKTPHSFEYKFPRLNTISIQYPADSTFRIFTWQLFVDDNDYRYYGAIQMNTGELTLHPLVDRSFEIRDLNTQTLSPNQWYGALYYNIKQFDTPEGRKYLLFGFDGYSFFEKRKLMEVLAFSDGKPVFGKTADIVKIDTKTGVKQPINRLVLTYTSAAAIRLNFDPAIGHVIHDHLILSGGAPGGGPTYIPDGSYEGYELVNGKWTNIPKVYNQTQEEPPRDFPVLDGENEKSNRKNIFGKKGRVKGR